MFDALHVYSGGEAHSAAMNMAVDEALLETASTAVLRFYGWRKPSLSFGYFGRFADVAEEHAHRELVRRWTGGGIVYHGSDLTYSIILPPDEASRFRSSRAVYAQVHGAIRQALAARLPVELAPSAAPKVSEACFANAVESDVISDGKKIAGAAQRRTRAGLLHQGSIQGETLPAGFCDDFARALCPAFASISYAPETVARATTIAREKYATREWLHRR
ncbi:MAG: Lipoate-protein ligase A [uncultured Chthoniobacterales bacterium]|uniref:Lipoate-protein ligase A n=1 Tax=uncultured Chthoniobacterales bacterium TaxID=1836801 RepID=A0A6J4HP46_9BACT|nr:MAG: Lipoate-protein ligase A [uncultured Chthoniobacterales bacterium]